MSYTILELPHKMQLNQYLLNGVTLKVKNARCIDGEFVNEHQCRKQGGGKAPKYQYLDGCTFSSQNGKVYAVTKKGNKKVWRRPRKKNFQMRYFDTLKQRICNNLFHF